MKKKHREKLVSSRVAPWMNLIFRRELSKTRGDMTLPSCGKITGSPIGPAPEMRNVFAVAEIKDFTDEWLPPLLSYTFLAANSRLTYLFITICKRQWFYQIYIKKKKSLPNLLLNKNLYSKKNTEIKDHWNFSSRVALLKTVEKIDGKWTNMRDRHSRDTSRREDASVINRARNTMCPCD